MLLSRFVTRHLFAASVAIFAVFGGASVASIQAQNAVPDATNADDKPIVPSKSFPSLIALDESDSVWTLKVAEGRLKVNGDVAVNSINRGALWMANGYLETQNGHVSVVGGTSRLGKNTIRPSEVLGGNVVSDPFPEFVIPAPKKVVMGEKLFLDTDEEDQLLPPGIYDGGIFATGQGRIKLKPGVFVITNGDFSAVGPTIEGEGVTIVMAGDDPGTLRLSLGAQLKASAPTSGKLKDFLVISRAAGTNATGVSFASALGDLKGIIYAPHAAVSVLSKSQVRASKIVALSVDVTGASLEVTGSGDVENAIDAEQPEA